MRPKVREKQVLVSGSVAKDPPSSICHDFSYVEIWLILQCLMNVYTFTLFGSSVLLQCFKREKSDNFEPNEKIHEPPWDTTKKLPSAEL